MGWQCSWTTAILGQHPKVHPGVRVLRLGEDFGAGRLQVGNERVVVAREFVGPGDLSRQPVATGASRDGEQRRGKERGAQRV